MYSEKYDKPGNLCLLYYRIVDSSQQSGTTFSLTGQLPPGLTLNPFTGVISGVYNPHGDQNGGNIVFGGQTNSHNHSGNGTNPLNIFVQRPCNLLKVATRGVVQSSNNQLVGTVKVAGNVPEKVMVRAIGPSLRVNGTPLPGRLQNPTLELDHTSSLIGQNDDWHTTVIGGIITSSQVAAKKCLPCEGGVPPCILEEAKAQLDKLPGWRLNR